MKKPIYLIISIIILTIPSFADQFDTIFSGGLNTTISEVATGGFWEQKQTYGTWRLVVRDLGWEHTRSFLYLQWLKTDDKNKNEIELKTVPIPEFNSANWHNVSNIEYKNGTFVISYMVRGEEVPQFAIIQPNLPGKYKIIMKSN